MMMGIVLTFTTSVLSSVAFFLSLAVVLWRLQDFHSHPQGDPPRRTEPFISEILAVPVSRNDAIEGFIAYRLAASVTAQPANRRGIEWVVLDEAIKFMLGQDWRRMGHETRGKFDFLPIQDRINSKIGPERVDELRLIELKFVAARHSQR